ncbi:capsular biosynthesis protein [Bacillus cereus]|uniref:capsular biosynthesis protein n=1 Tax=Bacillus cereus TaxID=1396 RepID=UPI000BF7E2DA|nr:capsular biosynthesis protein [Bacillus cereus]PFO93196.1 capsular biosynthesis protein [Bacillus cereus]PFR76811.1 capsular biosynthesis protein [Bacillus cereus]PGL97880.1 capsular biosynthesis protein [Bacillus cereus]PGV13490.1 capsular biosynthesis protein [Bacillus cereus]
MQLIINILRVVFSNVIMLVSNIVLGLFLPMYLSVKVYGEYRLFLFYLGYIGLLHFGFIDAMYLKYGGNNKEALNKNLLKKEHHVFLFYQLVVMVLIFTIGIFMEENLIILFAFAIIPLNLSAFHKLFYQATGQFKKYSYVNIVYTIINLIIICILLVIKIEDAIGYIIATIFAYVFICLIMERDFWKYTKGVRGTGKVNILEYNRVGIFILIGNICVILISSIGGWIVQFFFKIEDFAYYSFAVAMLNMILLVINAIALTFYNYIARNENREVLILVKNVLIVLGALAGSAYFFLQLVIELALPEYKLALSIIAISFMALPYMMIVNVIITNLYKARKQEKKYLKVVLSILSISIAFNVLAVSIFKSMDSIAVAMVLTFVSWYIYSTIFEFDYLRGSIKELFYLICHAIIFLIASRYFEWFNGLLVYASIMLTVSLVFYSQEFKQLFNRITNRNIVKEDE